MFTYIDYIFTNQFLDIINQFLAKLIHGNGNRLPEMYIKYINMNVIFEDPTSILQYVVH